MSIFLISTVRIYAPIKGGGRDRISPKSYERQFEKENELIKERGILGESAFSPYNEKLILKGCGKLPVLSLQVQLASAKLAICLKNSVLGVEKLSFLCGLIFSLRPTLRTKLSEKLLKLDFLGMY